MTRSEPNPEFFGPYRIVRSLGIGAYSEIFLVEKQGRESALKRNKPHYRYDRTVYQTLDQEAEVLRRLKGCPFFPGYIDSGVIDDCHFLEMEYIEGLSLFHLVEKKGGCLSPAHAAFIAHELCRALEVLHQGKPPGEKPIVHGDLKLENIMVDVHGQVKIIDLGLHGVTFRYMPLERLHDKKTTPYSDLYALGHILYELTHGKHLFEKASKFETYVKMRETRIDEALFRKDLPLRLKQILVRCLKQDDQERFQTAGELKSELDAFLEKESPPMTPAILGAWVRRLQRPVVEIKPMGHFLDLDAEGYLINEASSEKIVEPWKGAVEDVRKAYIENLGPALHSIYLRGSSARGTALQGISDVDTFAVCQGPPDKIPTAWAPDYYHHFMEKFPFANGLDMQFIHLDQLFRGVSHFSYRFIIKVLATCIHGPDLAERIPKFKPSLKIAFFYHGNLRQVLNESLQKIETAEDEEQIRLWSNYVLRRILRLGFAINIERENAYTRDLYPCYRVFSKYYPERDSDMRRVLHLTLNPPTTKEEILPLLRDFGGWLVLESERIFAGRPPSPA